MNPLPLSIIPALRQAIRQTGTATLLLALMLATGLAAITALAAGDEARAPAATEATKDSAVAAAVAQVDLARALEDARRLSGELPLCMADDCATLHNRVTGSQDLERALDWVVDSAEGRGFDVTVLPWTRGNRAGRNVFARRSGVVTPTEEVWYVTHVDGVASCPEGRCPAADDNASGTVEGLELLRALEDFPTARTVVVMFSTGEEQDSLGVRAWLDEAEPAELARIQALVNADMVGWDGDGDRVMEIYHGDEAPSIRLAEAMSQTLAIYAPLLRPRIQPGCG